MRLTVQQTTDYTYVNCIVFIINLSRKPLVIIFEFTSFSTEMVNSTYPPVDIICNNDFSSIVQYIKCK